MQNCQNQPFAAGTRQGAPSTLFHLTSQPALRMTMTTLIQQKDLIESVAAALQYISY